MEDGIISSHTTIKPFTRENVCAARNLDLISWETLTDKLQELELQELQERRERAVA